MPRWHRRLSPGPAERAPGHPDPGVTRVTPARVPGRIPAGSPPPRSAATCGPRQGRGKGPACDAPERLAGRPHRGCPRTGRRPAGRGAAAAAPAEPSRAEPPAGSLRNPTRGRRGAALAHLRPGRGHRLLRDGPDPGLSAFGFRPRRSHSRRNGHGHHNKGGDAAAAPARGGEDRPAGPGSLPAFPREGRDRLCGPERPRARRTTGTGAPGRYLLSSGNWSSSAILNEPRRFFKGCPPRCIVGRRPPAREVRMRSRSPRRCRQPRPAPRWPRPAGPAHPARAAARAAAAGCASWVTGEGGAGRKPAGPGALRWARPKRRTHVCKPRFPGTPRAGPASVPRLSRAGQTRGVIRLILAAWALRASTPDRAGSHRSFVGTQTKPTATLQAWVPASECRGDTG
jgi:hypothetical protein